MTFRRFQRGDIEEMVKHLEEGLKGFHYKRIHFDRAKVTNLLVGNLRNPAFFCDVVVADTGEIGGALAGYTVEYPFSYEAYAEDFITYVREGHRSLKTIVTLVNRYKTWANRQGVREVRWGQSTGFKMEKFAKLSTRLGFVQIGTKWSKET